MCIRDSKGGVGKSTLSFHLGKALGLMGKKVLFVDLDPQCNLTISAMRENELENIWQEEDSYIEDFETAKEKNSEEYLKIIGETRSIHFLLKPAEDGVNDIEKLPPARIISENVYMIPGRLSIHQFENKISDRWSGLYQSDNLSIRTITYIRRVCEMCIRDRFNISVDEYLKFNHCLFCNRINIFLWCRYSVPKVLFKTFLFFNVRTIYNIVDSRLYFCLKLRCGHSFCFCTGF